MIFFLKALCVGTIFTAFICNMYQIKQFLIIVIAQVIAIVISYYFFKTIHENEQKKESTLHDLFFQLENRIQLVEEGLVNIIKEGKIEQEILVNKQLEHKGKIWQEHKDLILENYSNLNKHLCLINEIITESKAQILEYANEKEKSLSHQNENMLVRLDEIKDTFKNELNEVSTILSNNLDKVDDNLQRQILLQKSIEKITKNNTDDWLKLIQITNKINMLLEDLCQNEQENLSQLKLLLKGINGLKGSINDSTDMIMEKTEELTDEYKNTQTYIMTQLKQVSESNKLVVELLMDNYKVLDAIISK